MQRRQRNLTAEQTSPNLIFHEFLKNPHITQTTRTELANVLVLLFINHENGLHGKMLSIQTVH